MANAWSPDLNQKCSPSAHSSLIDLILGIPELVLKHHSRKNLVDVVLCQLACHKGFGLQKAAYFVQNKDFNVTKGVSGFLREDCNKLCAIAPEAQVVDENLFDNVKYCRAIKNFRADGLIDDFKESEEFKDLISMSDPLYKCWESKHENYGTLLFQVQDPTCCLLQDSYFDNAVKLLCLC